MTWNSFCLCLINIVNQYVTFVLQDGNSGLLPQAPSETLDTFYNRILKLAKQCQFEPAEKKSRLIDAIIYGTSITKAQEKLLQTPITLTLEQCLGICRHYESLKYHLETIKPRTVEYLPEKT